MHLFLNRKTILAKAREVIFFSHNFNLSRKIDNIKTLQKEKKIIHLLSLLIKYYNFSCNILQKTQMNF